LPKILEGKVVISLKLSIGTKTVLLPFSESKVTLSAKCNALSTAPPIEILPKTAKPAFRFFL